MITKEIKSCWVKVRSAVDAEYEAEKKVCRMIRYL